MIRATVKCLLALAVITGVGFAAASISPNAASDELTKSFTRWFKDYKAGRIDPSDTRGPWRKPYISAGLLPRPRAANPGWTRYIEAKKLFGWLRKRGLREDGDRLVQTVLVGIKKRGGLLIGGKYWDTRKAAVAALGGKAASENFRTAVFDSLTTNLQDRKDEDDGLTAYSLNNPIAAGILAPVLGSFENFKNRSLLENLLLVDDQDVQAAAATGLALMRSGLSIEKVAKLFVTFEEPDLVITIADAIYKLVRSTNPPPKEEHLHFALNQTLRHLEQAKSWRTRLALLPILRSIRGKRSVPVLISLLEESNVAVSKAAGKDALSGTLLDLVHRTLKDLTGFVAGVKEGAKWRKWWEEEQARFTLAEPQKINRDKDGTTAETFFGIPITGSRVVFIIDISGSMLTPMGEPFNRRYVLERNRNAKYETRLDRVRKEIKKALSALSSDDKVNVVLFESTARRWKKKLVKANRGNKKAFCSYLDKTEAWGGTALYDALELAFQFKLKRKTISRYASQVDEIFLLTDGAPTAGEIIDPEQIAERVQEFNRGARVRLNTIYVGHRSENMDKATGDAGLGGLAPAKFMQRLAEENNGTYKYLEK